MRFYEYRQSATSPLKYQLQLNPEELERVKDLVMKIAQTIIQNEQGKCDEPTHWDMWIEANQDIVEWMTEPVKFPARSDCG
tara:strand:+ start:1715 stop:1957 length:243 start_codon:yes stop_codon:yes gene_type:complete